MFMHYEVDMDPVERLVGSKSSCSYVRARATSALKGHGDETILISIELEIPINSSKWLLSSMS